MVHGLERLARLLYPGQVEIRYEKETQVVKMFHGILARDTEEFDPKRDEHRTGPYAGGSHTVLRRTAPDETASYELRTGGEAAWGCLQCKSPIASMGFGGHRIRQRR